MREELKFAKSGAGSIPQNHLTVSHSSGQNELLQSMIAENRQRKTQLEEARRNTEQNHMKTY